MFSRESFPWIQTPLPKLPEIVLLTTEFWGASEMSTPLKKLARAAVPARLVPILLLVTVFCLAVAPATRTPLAALPEMRFCVI